jgi:hypothetical protein
VALPILAGLSTVSPIDALNVIGRPLKNRAGNLTICDAGPACGSKCAIDQAKFAVV